MSAPDGRDFFFVGWAGKTGPSLGRFLAGWAALILVGFLAVGIVLSATTDDAADGLFDLAPNLATQAPAVAEYVMREGVLSRDPYPILRTAPDADNPRGGTYLLSGDGKRGVEIGSDMPDGQTVRAAGVLVRRGTLAMLIVDGALETLTVPRLTLDPSVPLGRFRIVGEICDGKCYPGAMSPGGGLTHRACAILCFAGDVPLVFASAAPVFGQSFLVLADADGRRPALAIKSLIGIRVTLEGEVERRGDALIYKVDWSSAKPL
jgi:hypothetical protein